MGNSKKRKQNANLNAKNKKTNSLGVGFFVVPLIVLVFLYALIITLMEDGIYKYISPVFKNYESLEKTEDEPLDNYFYDEIGMFYDEDRFYLINESAEYLYEKTGVKVFLWGFYTDLDENNDYILPTEAEAQKNCMEALDGLSKNGIDLVILYVPTREKFVTYTYATEEVKNVYGNKLEKILQQYLEYNFCVVGEYDELFYYSYRQTADRITEGFTSPISLIKENLRVFVLALSTILVLAVSIIFYKKVGKKY